MLLRYSDFINSLIFYQFFSALGYGFVLLVCYAYLEGVWPNDYNPLDSGDRKEFMHMNIFPAALAEETADLSKVLENMTPEEAAMSGAFLGAAIGVMVVFLIVWYVFQAIADWKIFTKAGEPGWKSLIPIYNVYVEYDLCWNGMMGLVYVVAGLCANVLTSGQNIPNWKMIAALVLLIVSLVLHIIQSMKLARAYGKGTGFGICLILFGPIARLILGFGSARYEGHPDR